MVKTNDLVDLIKPTDHLYFLKKFNFLKKKIIDDFPKSLSKIYIKGFSHFITKYLASNFSNTQCGTKIVKVIL